MFRKTKLRVLPITILVSFILAWPSFSILAQVNDLLRIENTPFGKNQTRLDLTFRSSPDFEVIENIKHQIFIIKLRQIDIKEVKKTIVFDNKTLIQGIEIQPVDQYEYWLKIRLTTPNVLFDFAHESADSKEISVLFTREVIAEEEKEGIEITAVLRELNPDSERIILYPEQPIQYDVSRDRTKPGKMMKIRLLNARIEDSLVVPDAETDMIKTLRFEKRGKYLNLVIEPQTFVLDINTEILEGPHRLMFTVKEDKTEKVTDPDIVLIEEERKQAEADQEKKEKDRFLTRLLDEAEKYYKLGRFEQAALMFKNIYNFAPDTEIGVRARFRSADAFNQRQNETNEANGELFVIQEYKAAIDAALIADLGYEFIPRAYYNIGRNYYDLKFYEDAFNHFEIVLQKYPESPYSKNALFHQGIIHLNMERYEKSIELLKRFIEENSTSSRIHAAYYKMGEAQFQLKRFKEAKMSFDKAWSLNADYMRRDAELMFHMGEAYFENQDYQTARAIYEQLIDLYPNETFSNLVAIRIGDFLREEDKLDDAIKAYEKAKNEYPRELSLIGDMRIANILAEKPGDNHHQRALDIYDNIIKINGLSDQYEEAFLRKALTLSLFHEYPSAIANLEAFCEVFPDNIYVKNDIIHDRILSTIKSYIAHYYNKNEYLNALGVFEQYENKYFKRPQYSKCFRPQPGESNKEAAKRLISKAPLFLISDSYYRLRLYDKALEYYDLILENPADPLASVVLFNKGQILDNLEMPEEAQQVFMRFISLYPNHVYTPMVKKTLGDSYFKVHKADRISRAIRIYRQTIRDYEDSENILEREIIPSCWFALGNLYQGIGRYDDSIDAYKNVLNSYEHPLQSEFVDNIVVDTYFILGNLYKELNQLPEAMATYNEAIRLFPQSEQTPWAKYHQGEIYMKNDKKDKALEIFEELMEASRENPDALWGPMARELQTSIRNDLQFDRYLTRTPDASGEI